VRCADPGLAELAPGTPVTIAVRPEALRIELAAGSGGGNRLPVEVRSVNFVGPTSRIQVIHAGAPEQPLLVKVPSRMGGLPIRVGDAVDLVWAATDCVAIAGDPP
jgi:ABC-type Fe3+/spermidine/putrescine transport system ATPase subunit